MKLISNEKYNLHDNYKYFGALGYPLRLLNVNVLYIYIFVSTLQEYNVSSLPRMLGGLSGCVGAAVLTCHILEFRTAAALGTR